MKQIFEKAKKKLGETVQYVKENPLDACMNTIGVMYVTLMGIVVVGAAKALIAPAPEVDPNKLPDDINLHLVQDINTNEHFAIINGQVYRPKSQQEE